MLVVLNSVWRYVGVLRGVRLVGVISLVLDGGVFEVGVGKHAFLGLSAVLVSLVGAGGVATVVA